VRLSSGMDRRACLVSVSVLKLSLAVKSLKMLPTIGRKLINTNAKRCLEGEVHATGSENFPNLEMWRRSTIRINVQGSLHVHS
jgi:hypothetical protein